MACLDDAGLAEIDALMDYYLENAKILKEVRRTRRGAGCCIFDGNVARSRGFLAAHPLKMVLWALRAKNEDTVRRVHEVRKCVVVERSTFGTFVQASSSETRVCLSRRR